MLHGVRQKIPAQGARLASTWAAGPALPRAAEFVDSMGGPLPGPQGHAEQPHAHCWAPPPAAGSFSSPWDGPAGTYAYDLMAVPKRKVTPSRKGMRSTHKHWKPIPVVAQCSHCGKVMKQHEVPHKCEEAECPSMQYSRATGQPATIATE
mmetsp:Transcript_35547/g.90877  ORF Transcript_35547/g.90877 Transcript_35547/m.90877 type:complete len:150 (+) Transcript_35547:214-663(+)